MFWFKRKDYSFIPDCKSLEITVSLEYYISVLSLLSYSTDKIQLRLCGTNINILVYNEVGRLSHLLNAFPIHNIFIEASRKKRLKSSLGARRLSLQHVLKIISQRTTASD